jgi:hypothetical protein
LPSTSTSGERRSRRFEAWFDTIGEALPTQLRVELDGLKARLGVA